MTVQEQIERKHQEDLQRLRGFRLLDDDFLTKCFEEGTQCIQLVLRIVLEMPVLEVVSAHTQVVVEHLLTRSVRLDGKSMWKFSAPTRALDESGQDITAV